MAKNLESNNGVGTSQIHFISVQIKNYRTNIQTNHISNFSTVKYAPSKHAPTFLAVPQLLQLKIRQLVRWTAII